MLPGFKTGDLFGAGYLQGYVASDGATTPMYGAVHSSAFYDAGLNKTFMSWEAWTGRRTQRVTILDHDTGYFSEREGFGVSAMADDSHGNVGSLLLDHEDYLHAFYGAHADLTPNTKHSVTRWPIDGTELAGSHWSIEPDIAGDYTYPHAVMVGSTMYLMVRDTDVAGTRMPPVLHTTTALSGGVATWSAGTTLVDLGADHRFYQGTTRVVGTDIHFVAAKADYGDTSRAHVYYFVYDTVTGALSNHDKSFSVASGSLPMTAADANTNCRVFIHPGGNDGNTPSMAFDTNGDPFIAVSNGSGASFDITVMKRTGGVWGAEEAAATTDYRYNNYAIGPLPGGKMEILYENDPGALWGRGGNIMRVERSAAGVWSTPEMILEATDFALGQPGAVRDAHIRARFVFCEIKQNDNDATAGGLKIYLWGSRGLIPYSQEPEDPSPDSEESGVELREDGFAELREDGFDELREVAI
jgi:hypothetical protein